MEATIRCAAEDRADKGCAMTELSRETLDAVAKGLGGASLTRSDTCLELHRDRDSVLFFSYINLAAACKAALLELGYRVVLDMVKHDAEAHICVRKDGPGYYMATAPTDDLALILAFAQAVNAGALK